MIPRSRPQPDSGRALYSVLQMVDGALADETLGVRSMAVIPLP
jgi:hypothetical protein